MPLVRARCSDDGDLASGAFAILGAVGVSEDVVFPDCIHAQQLLACTLWRNVLAGRVVSNVIHAIHREAVGFGPLPTN